MSTFGTDLIKSLTGALAHARGARTDARAHVVEMPDARAIRRGLRLSQQAFAAACRIPLPTLKNWEQGRRHPDAPAAAYPRAIARRPEEIRAVFASEPDGPGA